MATENKPKFAVITSERVETTSAPPVGNNTNYQSNPMYEKLLNFRNLQNEQKKKVGNKWKEQGFIFTNEVGDMISLYAPTNICSQYEERCGLRHLKLHGLRHTCGSLLANHGVDLETVKAVLGHESIRTTELYLTPYDESKQKAAVLLADLTTNRKEAVENCK